MGRLIRALGGVGRAIALAERPIGGGDEQVAALDGEVGHLAVAGE